MKSSELYRLILKNGWKLLRVSGSHYINENSGTNYPVRYHGAKEIGKGIESKIRKDMKLK